MWILSWGDQTTELDKSLIIVFKVAIINGMSSLQMLNN